MAAHPPDATSALLRAIAAQFAARDGFAVENIKSRSWASATFLGARHELIFGLSGATADAAADAFVSRLDSIEFALRGHIVADIALVSDERRADGVRIAIEALTVEDA